MRAIALGLLNVLRGSAEVRPLVIAIDLVGEVIVGLLQSDRASYLAYDADWRPASTRRAAASDL
jgi:hypothetical protein